MVALLFRQLVAVVASSSASSLLLLLLWWWLSVGFQLAVDCFSRQRRSPHVSRTIIPQWIGCPVVRARPAKVGGGWNQTHTIKRPTKLFVGSVVSRPLTSRTCAAAVLVHGTWLFHHQILAIDRLRAAGAVQALPAPCRSIRQRWVGTSGAFRVRVTCCCCWWWCWWCYLSNVAPSWICLLYTSPSPRDRG